MLISPAGSHDDYWIWVSLLYVALRGEALAHAPFYRSALETVLHHPIQGLYSNSSSSMGLHTGIFDEYRFGLYTYCSYRLSAGEGHCSHHKAGRQYQPHRTLASDLTEEYANITNQVLGFRSSRFQDSTTLGPVTQTAYYFILISTLPITLSFLLCVTSFFIYVMLPDHCPDLLRETVCGFTSV
jgi:hypothetical protein